MNERTVHLQKLVFSAPEDQFYVASFAHESGQFVWESTYDQPQQLVEVPAQSRAVPGIVQNLSDKRYVLVTRRISDEAPKYETVLVERGSNKEVLSLGLNNSGEFFGGDFYFVGGGKAMAFEPKSERVREVDQGVTAIAVTNGKLIKFTLRGEILSTDGKRIEQVAAFHGLVSNAGALDDRWVWYYRRQNEKALGELWLLDLTTNRQRVVDKKLPQCRVVSNVQ